MVSHKALVTMWNISQEIAAAEKSYSAATKPEERDTWTKEIERLRDLQNKTVGSACHGNLCKIYTVEQLRGAIELKKTYDVEVRLHLMAKEDPVRSELVVIAHENNLQFELIAPQKGKGVLVQMSPEAYSDFVDASLRYVIDRDDN